MGLQIRKDQTLYREQQEILFILLLGGRLTIYYEHQQGSRHRAIFLKEQIS